MFYDLLKSCTSVFFNVLNKLLGGKLPPFGSACVVVEKEGKFLAIELPHERTTFPGGFMNWSEKPRQSAEREGYEETGLQLHATKLIGTYSHASSTITQMSNICFAYMAEVVGGELRKSAEGNPCWLSEEELRARLAPVTLTILDDYLHQQQPEAKRRFFWSKRAQALEQPQPTTGNLEPFSMLGIAEK